MSDSPARSVGLNIDTGSGGELWVGYVVAAALMSWQPCSGSCSESPPGN